MNKTKPSRFLTRPAVIDWLQWGDFPENRGICGPQITLELIAEYKEEYAAIESKLIERDARIEQLEAALGFYADESSWGWHELGEHVAIDRCDWRQTSSYDGLRVFIRGGKKARNALAKEEGT